MRVECRDVLELDISSDREHESPFRNVVVTGTFKSAGKSKPMRVEGFYDGDNTWRVRFVPPRPGRWVYAVELDRAGRESRRHRHQPRPLIVHGSFDCESAPGRRGFVRVSKRNPYRFEYDDGTPFYPIGQQMGSGVSANPPFDAPDDAKWYATDRETFLKAFDGATNLVRSQLGCGTTAGVAMDIIKEGSDPDTYDLENSRKIDDSCRAIKRMGWAQMLIPFQDMSLWGDYRTTFGSVKDTRSYKTLASPQLESIERYLRYVVARWGAYTDFWEIYNEDAYCPNDFLAHLANVIRAADPYAHPITTNYERPRESWCEIVCPHVYMVRPANFVPNYLAERFGVLKSFGKPVLYTEFGNKGALSNDDPVKWRLAAWVAFMNEGGMVFWNMSGRKTKPTDNSRNSNCWLGPETRRHWKVLAEFTRDLPVTMRPAPVTTAGRLPVDAWCLSDGPLAVAYFHNPGDYSKPTEPGEVPLMIGPGRWSVKWVEPETGEVACVTEQETDHFILWLKTPAVRVDLACRLELRG